jgi:RNA polymerase sigma-70 factor (ECF subfamily)
MAELREEAADESLMVSYQRGDRHAFALLVQRYERPIYNFVLRQLRDPATAEDTTQEVFLRVVQNAAEFKHEARFTTWLYAIARNLCIDQLRKLKHRRHPSLNQPKNPANVESPTLLESMPNHSPEADAERSMTSNHVARTVVAAVEGLPDDQREVFLLRQMAGLPFKDIAGVVGVGENTVKSRMRYALERLQQALSEFEEYARALK